jgi:hypothetical protein
MDLHYSTSNLLESDTQILLVGTYKLQNLLRKADSSAEILNQMFRILNYISPEYTFHMI